MLSLLPAMPARARVGQSNGKLSASALSVHSSESELCMLPYSRSPHQQHFLSCPCSAPPTTLTPHLLPTHDHRFSSAVIASLVTSTPIIANQAFLDAYSFLDSSHVFIQGTQESELDVMKRVLQVGAAARCVLYYAPC